MGAGVLLTLGLLTPVAAAGVIGVMVVAGWTVHRSNGFFIIKEGWEYVFILAVMALVSASLGPAHGRSTRCSGSPTTSPAGPASGSPLLLGVGGGALQMLVFFRPSKVAVGGLSGTPVLTSTWGR